MTKINYPFYLTIIHAIIVILFGYYKWGEIIESNDVERVNFILQVLLSIVLIYKNVLKKEVN